MKKILLFVLSFICLKSFGQYINNPSPYANENTLSRYWGGFKSRLINRPFSDTTQANTTPIDFYDGAQIWTTTDNKFWLRDSANHIWVQPGGSVTGANNGNSLDGSGNVRWGNTGSAFTASTRVSAANFPFLLDSLGTGSTFKAYPNSSASVFRYFKIVNGNTSDSAYLWIGGKTAATTRTVQLGVNASANNSNVAFYANNTSGNHVFGGVQAISPTRLSYVLIDTLSAFLASTKTSPSIAGSSIYLYPDSMALFQTDGDYYVYNLQRITDSTGLDLMAWDRSNSEWVRIPSDIVGGAGGATPNLQTVFAVESNSPVMTANANEIKLNPAGSSGVAKTFTLGATSFADDSRIFISNDGTGNGAFDVWAQDSANTNQVFLRSDITNKRVYLHSARGVASSANNLFVYSDSTVFQFTLGTADYRFKGVTDLFYTDTTLNKPAVFDAQGRLRRLSYWPSGGAAGANTALSNLTSVAINTDFNVNNQLLYGNSNAYNDQTGTTYTLVSGDNGKIVTISNASAITLTVPASLPAGFNCTIVQKGAGQITFAASGTTINNRQSFTKTAGQYSIVTIVQYAANLFITQGDMQ